jgi:hypothetical protein
MTRAHQLRNGLVAIFNGIITLIILLIAPLGLAAVVVNTLLVTAATYVVSSIADWVIVWLLPAASAELLSSGEQKQGNIARTIHNSLLQQRRRQ